MKVKRLTLTTSQLPVHLHRLKPAVQQLHIWGRDLNELLARPRIAIVGSRKVSAYGTAVTLALAGALAKAGVVIVSGLAIGVDGVAHRAALEAGGLTLAVLPSGLDYIYPTSHRQLASRIAVQGGAVVTEYNTNNISYKSCFIARNRIVAALADAVLITEAAERSGTLSTARFALEQGKDVLAVPGNITSPTSAGTNNLIKTGATPVTSAADVLHALGLEQQGSKAAPRSSDPHEQVILTLIYEGITDGAELARSSQLDIALFNQTMTMLEITGRIRALGGNQWALS